MQEKLKINLDEIEDQFADMPQQIYLAAMKCIALEEKTNSAKADLEEFQGKLSNDIALYPEKYGFPNGTEANRFKVLGKVKSTEEFRKFNRAALYYEYRLKQQKIFHQALRDKFEALKCLINKR